MTLFFFTCLYSAKGQGNMFFSFGELTFRPGIVLDKKVTDLYSFDAGLNLIGTHGLLKSRNIIYYGFEVSYAQTKSTLQEYQGAKVGLTYQLVRNYVGFNFNNYYQNLSGLSFWKTEFGMSFLGIISLNYGYYLPFHNEVNFNRQNLNLNMKLSLNLSYGECLNMVGTVDKKW